ncbi:hypothetical protein [Saltatorellus ferox]|uniref:FG-GAP repeat protein n=1 Tax=Saltatorellus ferox TaxID=2528018 RepID=UPI003AF3F3A3
MDPPFIMVGAGRSNNNDGGALFVRFDTDGSLIAEERFDYWLPDAQFGQFLDIGHDGTIAVGIPNADFAGDPLPGVGGISIGSIAAGTYAEHQLIRPGPAQMLLGGYGLGVSIELDGDTLAVGAHGLNYQGAVHMYERDGTGLFSLVQVIQPHAPFDLDRFGRDVAVEGDVMVIGEPRSGGAGSGRAYVFRRHPVARSWIRGETLRAANPLGTGNVGDRFGDDVALDDGLIAVGAHRHDQTGRVYLFRPSESGRYQPTESSYLTNSFGTAGFGTTLAMKDGFLAATASYGSPAAFALSVSPEVDFCEGTRNGAASAPHLDTWIDSTAHHAASALPRRGFVLSAVPAGTRYIVLGSLNSDALGTGVLFSTPGLCLRPPLIRMGFGRTGGTDELELMGANALFPIGDQILTTLGTIFCQAYCATPPGSAGLTGWTNGIELAID